MNPDNIVRFCMPCGSSLFALVRDGQFFHVKLGTLVEDPGIRPIFHIFVGSQAPWHEITDSLPHYAELPLRRRPDFSRTRLQHGHQRNGGRHGTADDQNG